MKNIKFSSGFGTVEYLLGVVMLTGILFTPVNNGNSLSRILINAVKAEHSAYIYAASMPILPTLKKDKKKKK